MKISGRTRTLLAAGVAAAGLLAAPGGATGATYTQYTCHKPGAQVAPADGFTASRYGTGTGHPDTCTGGGSGGLVAHLPHWGAGAAYDTASAAQWSYTVPAGSGLTIKRVQMGRGADGIGDGIRFAIRDGNGSVRDYCTARAGHNGIVCPAFGSGLTLTDLGTGFSFVVHCPDSGTCRQPFSDARPEGRIDHVQIDLEDGSPPEITNSPMGTGLFNTGSPRSGNQLVSYSAQDVGGVLYRAALRIDGQEVVTRPIDSNDGKCQTPFVHRVPCKTGPVNDSFSFDTTQIPDGQHLVQLVVRDATDVNQAVYGPVEITIDNIPSPSPREGSGPTIEGSPRVANTLTANPGQWSGDNVTFSYQWMRCDADGGACGDIGTGTEQSYTVSSRDAGSRLRVRVVGTNDQGFAEATSAPTPAIATATDPNSGGRTPVPPGGAQTPEERGVPNGAGASDRARLSAFFGRARRTTVRTRYGRSARLSGRLVDPDNNPIAGATLNVMAEPRVRAAQMDDLGTVRTDADGRFTYTLSAGPSRLVRIGYRSHTGDTQFADTTDVLVLVQAGVSLRPSPRKLRNGNVGTFSGRAAQPIPLRGVLVDLQVRVGRQWRTFAVVRTGRDGRYRYRHRFRNTFVATTFRFRARVRRETDYPYVIGYSRVAKLRVRP